MRRPISWSAIGRGSTEAQIVTAATRACEAATELADRGGDVEFLGSIFVPGDETVFCLFEGDEASIRAEICFERMLESLQIGGSYLGPRGNEKTPRRD